MDDHGLLPKPALPVDLRPSQGTRDSSTHGLQCQSPSPWPSSPMDVDDLLSEILLRLPSLPSSLPRASLVCTHWRRLITDPSFIRRFRAHHWKPLGVFFGRDKGLSFSFFLGPRGSTPPERFSVRVLPECPEAPAHADCGWEFLDGRHGRVVLANYATCQILVWNPVTGEDHLLGVSQFFDANQRRSGLYMKAAVVCASSHNGPFKLALVWDDMRSSNAHVRVYSSETGLWGDAASAAIQPFFSVGCGNVMVGNTLYWIVFGSRVRILQYDFGSHDLSVIEVPADAIDDENHCGIFLCTLAKGGGLSLMVMSENLRGQLWVWEKMAGDSDSVSQWMLGETIELEILLSLRSEGEGHRVLWLEGNDNVMFVSTYKGIFMVDLQSMQFERVFETGPVSHWSIVPFKYLHAPGDILQQGGVGSSVVQGRGRAHGEDGADRWVPHVNIQEGGAQACVAGLKRADAHVSWEGGGPVW